jgi:uncharacterized protein YkwD
MALNRLFDRHPWRLLVLCAGLSANPAAQADMVSAVQLLREGGCGGLVPPARPLHHSALLDRAAESWAAAGGSPAAAAKRSGYEAESAAGLHLSGPASSAVQLLRRKDCRTVADQSLRDVGEYHRGSDTWLVLASAYAVPARSQAPVLAMRALQLVNEVRARGSRCGERSFAPAPPVRLSERLASVAFGQDLAGHSPAERVRAAGYQEKLVGENIAYGPKSAEEVVQGWLDSPGHCENIMDPRFAEMGIAYAAGRASKRGLYWVQLLADPRA